jgi:magnesium transporter
VKNPILIPEIRDLLKNKKFSVLKSFIEDSHEKETAEFLSLLTPREIWKILTLTDINRRAEIFSYFDMDVQVLLVTGAMKKHISGLLENMSSDDRADLFQHLDREIAGRLLVMLPVTERADVIKMTSYEDGTVGAIMTSDFAVLNENDTVRNSTKKIRDESPAKETIYYIYVTDNSERLIGFVSLRKLIVSKPGLRVRDIMKKDIVFARTTDDQERAARLIDEYDLIALPIIDERDALVGILTYDDAIDILKEEQTEDLEKLMAISGGVEEKSYLDVHAFTHFKKRAFWVITLGIFGLLTGLVIQGFQQTLESLIILTFYMPLLTATGGNTGSQSATVVMRSLTLRELLPGDWGKVVKKEFLISFLLALCLALVVFARVFLLSDQSRIPEAFDITRIAVVIAVSLAVQVVVSTILGAIVPMAATKLKIDPALISSPLLATVVDMSGVLIYFTTAKLILGI